MKDLQRTRKGRRLGWTAMGAMLAVLATMTVAQAATAPTTSAKALTSSARMTSTSLDAKALLPVWIYGENVAKSLGRAPANQTTAVASRLAKAPGVATTLGQRTGVRVLAIPPVQVPNRPVPRDPFAPRG